MTCKCGLAVDAAHPAAFHRHCASQAAAGHRISAGLASQAGRALGAARARRALSDERVSHWAERVITASSDQEARETIAAIDALAGLDGPGPGADGEFMYLFPPAEQARMRAAAERRAKIAASYAYDDAEDDEFLYLDPPKPGQEKRWAASKLAASARRAAEPISDAEADALFPGRPS